MVPVNFQPTVNGSVRASRHEEGGPRWAVVHLLADEQDSGVALFINERTLGIYTDLIAYLQDEVAWIRGDLDDAS